TTWPTPTRPGAVHRHRHEAPVAAHCSWRPPWRLRTARTSPGSGDAWACPGGESGRAMARATPASTTRHPLREGAQVDARERRAAARTLVHSAVVAVLIMVAYCVLPFSGVVTTATAVSLLIGLALV